MKQDKSMNITINLDERLVDAARSYSGASSWSIPKQIEHWVIIGRVAEENPELSYHFIRDILIALKEVKMGEVEEYKPGKL